MDVSYSKGRGRGLLGFSDKLLDRKPGAQTSAPVSTAQRPEPSSNDGKSRDKGAKKVIIAMYSYTANPDSPGGFKELSVQKGQLLMLHGEHPDNEHWWEVANEDGDVGFVPSSYVIIKDDQCLPWLQLSSLKSEEEERKERVKRLTQQKLVAEGKGFGPPPKESSVAKPYVSAYSRNQVGITLAQDPDRFYCALCDKRLNGPKPYAAHMASKAHKEEMARQDLED